MMTKLSQYLLAATLVVGAIVAGITLEPRPAQAQGSPSTLAAMTATSAVCTSAASCVALDVSTNKDAAVQVSGTFTATLSFEASVDGVNFVAFNMTPSNSGTDASSATAAGAFAKSVGGYRVLRARCSAYTSGTLNVAIQAH